MSTLTGKFIQDILKNNKQDKLAKDINLTDASTVISGVTEEIILEALKKLGKKEIDDEVVAEVEKMVQADRSAKRQVLRKIIEDN
jgi:hypothetical protein